MISIIRYPPSKGGAIVLSVGSKSIRILSQDEIKKLNDSRFDAYRRKFLNQILPEVEDNFDTASAKVIRTCDYLRHALATEYKERKRIRDAKRRLEHLRKMKFLE